MFTLAQTNTLTGYIIRYKIQIVQQSDSCSPFTVPTNGYKWTNEMTIKQFCSGAVEDEFKASFIWPFGSGEFCVTCQTATGEQAVMGVGVVFYP